MKQQNREFNSIREIFETYFPDYIDMVEGVCESPERPFILPSQQTIAAKRRHTPHTPNRSATRKSRRK